MTAKPPSLARIWSGPVPSAKADEYEDYLRQTGVAELSATPGNRGVFLLRRDLGSETEFTVLSLWEDEAAIQRFAGEEFHKAVYFPQDRDYLLRMDPDVLHYEIRASHIPG